jgi:hypothetical protein
VSISFSPLSSSHSVNGVAVAVRKKRRSDRNAFLALFAGAVVTMAAVTFLRAREKGPVSMPLAPVPVAVRLPTLPAASAAVPQPLVFHPAFHPPSAKGNQKTAERQAADAVHTGDRRRALAIYTELAQRYPENPAFAAAAIALSRGTTP